MQGNNSGSVGYQANGSLTPWIQDPRGKGTPSNGFIGPARGPELNESSFYGGQSSQPWKGSGAGGGEFRRQQGGPSQAREAAPRGRAAVTRQAAKESQVDHLTTKLIGLLLHLASDLLLWTGVGGGGGGEAAFLPRLKICKGLGVLATSLGCAWVGQGLGSWRSSWEIFWVMQLHDFGQKQLCRPCKSRP